MAWDTARIAALCRPVGHRPGTGRRPTGRTEGVVMSIVGELPVSVHPRHNSLRATYHVGAAVNLTAEQACRVLELVRAVECYPKPVGRTDPGEVWSHEVGGESG